MRTRTASMIHEKQNLFLTLEPWGGLKFKGQGHDAVCKDNS